MSAYGYGYVDAQKRIRELEDELARLKDGLRLIWDIPPGEHLNRARDIARALLAEDGAAGGVVGPRGFIPDLVEDPGLVDGGTA